MRDDPTSPTSRVPLRWGIAALLATAAIVLGVHGGALAALTEDDLVRAAKQDRFTAAQKLRRREPLSERETAAMDWRPGQPPPPIGDPQPWFWAAGALGAAALVALVPWGRRRPPGQSGSGEPLGS